MLGNKYIKNHYRIIAVHLSRKKELDADLKSIQRIQLAEQLQNSDGENANGIQSMFFLTISEKKIKETRLKFLKEEELLVKDDKLCRSES